MCVNWERTTKEYERSYIYREGKFTSHVSGLRPSWHWINANFHKPTLTYEHVLEPKIVTINYAKLFPLLETKYYIFNEENEPL